jgi:hypothetical protein
MEDTVERDVAGLAEKIITEDEERRAQELVRRFSITIPISTHQDPIGCIQHRS